MAMKSAENILCNYAMPVPRVYRLVWTVSASAVAAAIYFSLDILTRSRHDQKTRTNMIELLSYSAVGLKKHAPVALHAAGESLSVQVSGEYPLVDEFQGRKKEQIEERNKGTHRVRIGGSEASCVILPFV